MAEKEEIINFDDRLGKEMPRNHTFACNGLPGDGWQAGQK